MRNRVRELFERQEVGYGISLNVPDPVVVELIGLAGFEFVFIDLEHSGIELMRLETLLRTALGSGLGTVVRAPGPRSELTPRILDLGVDCVLVPRVRGMEDVAHAIEMARFPPFGDRGVAEGSRTFDYGAHRDSSQDGPPYDAQVLGVMIETVGAVEAIEDIVKADGLDFVFIGPEDLAASMGHIGQRGHPDVEQAVRHVIASARAAGMRFAMGAGHPAVSIPREQLSASGATLILSGRDSNVLLSALRSLRQGSRPGSGF